MAANLCDQTAVVTSGKVMSVFRLVVLCIALGFAAAPASAASRVQFQVFYVPFVDTLGRHGQVPLSVALEVPTQQSASAICSVGPRVRDTLLTSLRKQTYRLDRDGRIDTGAIEERIRPVIEGAVGKDNVLDVDVSMDPPKVSAAAASGAFARLGCMSSSDQANAEKEKR